MLAKASNAFWIALEAISFLLRGSSGISFVLLALCTLFILLVACVLSRKLAIKLFDYAVKFVGENRRVTVCLFILTALFVASIITVAAYPQVLNFVMSKFKVENAPEQTTQFAAASAEPPAEIVVAPVRADLAIHITAPAFFKESAIVFAEELKTRTLIRIAQVALKDGEVTFPDLPLGKYRITAIFRLSSGEIFTDSTVSNNDGNRDWKPWRALPEKRKGEIFNLDGYRVNRRSIPKLHEKMLSERWRRRLPANYCILTIGFSDEIGPDWVHDEIGLLRANVVEDLLVALGAREECLYTMTVGNRKPAQTGHPNGTPQNRRVVVIIMPNIFQSGAATKIVQSPQRRSPRSEELLEMRTRLDARNKRDAFLRRRRKGRILCGFKGGH